MMPCVPLQECVILDILSMKATTRFFNSAVTSTIDTGDCVSRSVEGCNWQV